MDSHDLDILTRLDTELPLVDPEIARLDAQLAKLADPPTLARLQQCYRHGLVRFGERCILSPEHGSITPDDVAYLFASAHETIPADTDPAVIALLDQRLSRLIAIGVNIATDRPPLT